MCVLGESVNIVIFKLYIKDFDGSILIDEHDSSENTDRLNDKSVKVTLRSMAAIMPT